MTSRSYEIRPAERPDAQDILRLIKELATYEKEPDSACATIELLHTNVFDEGHVASALVAVEQSSGKVVGFALYFFNFSTWTGRPGIYLEDLFVEEAHRKAGLGKRFFVELTRIAKERKCARIDWQVLDWNKPSRDFYKSIGAKEMEGWLPVRVTEDGFGRLEKLS